VGKLLSMLTVDFRLAPVLSITVETSSQLFYFLMGLLRHQLLESLRLLPEPLGIRGGTIEDR